MTVKDIVEKYLKDNNLDGLCGDGCACDIDDLIPCEGECDNCEAGKKIDCPGGEDCDLDGDCDYHIEPIGEIK